MAEGRVPGLWAYPLALNLTFRSQEWLKRPDNTYMLNYAYPKSIGYIAPFYGNFAIYLRAYAYILLLGGKGLVEVSENAVLNANYLMSRLKGRLDLAVDHPCMHEFVLSAQRLAREHGIRALDIAKALIDEGFHPPTIYFPLIVHEALMIEPTETESRETLDSFADALLDIVARAEQDPEALHATPVTAPVNRPDEVLASRGMDFAYVPQA